MENRYNVDDMAFLLVSNRIVREVKIIKISGGLYTIRFVEGGGGIKVRESRLFPTEEEAKASIQKIISKPTPEQTHPHPTPWD